MADDDSSLLFPIGHCIGAYYDLPDSNDHFVQVRVGADVKRLDDHQFTVWGMAHASPGRPVEEPWNRQALLAVGSQTAIDDFGQIVESLIEDELIVEATPETDSAVDFARRHRLIPLMLGLGNTAEEPWIYSVGLIGMPLVQMSAMAYDLFEWAHMDPNLWVACEGAAATAVRVGIDDPLATDPQKLLNAFLRTLPVMLSPNAAYLDHGLGS